jgi:guanylate kinase
VERENLYDFPRWPLLIVVSGPAGVGKDSLLYRMKEREYPLHYVVTATDRAPRPGEVDGVDYCFYSTTEFLRMEEEGELLEHAVVYGQHKGVPKQHVRDALSSGKDVIMRVDVQGAATIRAIAPDALLIFLAPSSEEELAGRLRKRGTDTEEQLAVRLSMASEEMAQAKEFDYVVFNADGELDRAVEQVGMIIEAEHCRTKPRRVQL